MNEAVSHALRVYGEFLDSDQRMSPAVVEAIRAIREYVYGCDPTNQAIHQTIITAKRNGMSGAALEALVNEIGS
jgi:hypothetical protein